MRGKQLVLGEDEGGPRHFLDGEPVHCGTGLLLLGAEPGDVPAYVRYEADLALFAPTARLYHEIAGYIFSTRVESHMRFAWVRG